MLNKTYFLIAFMLISIHAYSQEDEVIEKKNEEIVPMSLVATQDVVFELRKNYGIEVSVELTKALWQVLHSYSNQQQAQIIWQSAISKVTTLDSSLSTVVNSYYNAGEVMITYVNGMSEKKWNEKRRFSVVNKEKLDDFLRMNDDLTIYFNLLPVWNLLLEDVGKHENINWQTVFQKSLKVFEQKELVQDSSDKKLLPLAESEPQNEQSLGEMVTIVTEFKAWIQSDNRIFDLSILMRKVDLLKDKGRSLALIRFVLAKDSEQLLSATMSWFALAQQLIGDINSFNEAELNFYQQFIEENDTWFLTQEQNLIAVDTRLPELIESSFHQLKPLVKNPQNITSVKFTSVYELLYSDFGKYMSSPFRKKIRTDLEVCLNISEEFAPYPQEPIDEKQFKGCVDDIYNAAVNEATSRELSGTLIKVENKQALDRALALPVWQTINILYANLASVECLKTTKQLPNPLEWTMAAESLLWFADRWPAYMDKYQQRNKIQDIISKGSVLVEGLVCATGKKREVLTFEFNRVVQSWKQVETDIQKVIEEFNATFLKAGSDLDLIDDTQSKSNYRVEGAKIAACDVQNSCGVLVELEPSKALYNLFPNHLLVADQLKLGNVKLCYDDVGWEDRRAAPTHLDNNNVANYMGKFSFSLKGFYNNQLVFSRKITDKQEYNYIFAANTQEVLNTYCPLSIVGDKISTKLERGTFGLVPNRLTFLTASRANETDILVGNWAAGEEWENAMLSDNVEVLSEDNLEDLQTNIVTAYQKKAKQLQDIIYKSILNKQPKASDAQKGLASSFATMQQHEKLLFSYNYLLQMDRLMQDDDLHGLFFGSNKVVDASTIKNHFDNQMNINVLQSEVEQNLKSNQEKWNALSNQVSNSHILSLLYRLDSIYP
jgi:hypothetical protein